MEDCREEESQAVSRKLAGLTLCVRAYVRACRTDLFCRRGTQVLVSLQQTLAEGGLIRWGLHPGKGHLTLTQSTPQSCDQAPADSPSNYFTHHIKIKGDVWNKRSIPERNRQSISH